MRGLFYLVLGVFLSVDAMAALPRRATPVRGGQNADVTASGTGTSTSARAARAPVARSAAPTSASSSGAKVVSRGRSATNVTAPAPVTQSTTVQRGRAAAKQNVIGGGTKITTAAQNTLVDEDCRQKFDGCMDAFCMLDNANGGRCLCSDRSAELDVVLAEIQKLDEESYKLATVGVEKIEMGESGDAIMAQANAVAESLTAKKEEDKKAKRKALDLSNWSSLGADFDEEVEGLFSPASDPNSIENKTGDALLSAASKLCSAQMSQCSSQIKMLDLMYKQRVRSDCTAYENSLRQSRTQSAQKLAAAQTAMREAALEQYKNANKYDLGECTIEFKKCIQTTAGCGDDFTGCVGLAAMNEAATKNKVKSKKSKQYTIKGATAISFAATTYDTLEAKKTICMDVTNQCVSVRDKVWDAFLREAAPAIKSAELSAESDLRTSCISTISDCFQKACKETMDPNDPDGSYDMCLTRPETLYSVCKVEIDRCDTAEPQIFTYVKERLASMRVDACTKEFKACLTSEDRCGSDYTQCVGLKTDAIVDMCPEENLVACKTENGKATDVRDQLADIASGIFLNIDNNTLKACQKALDTSMIRVCGATDNCDALAADSAIGTRAFQYKVCEVKGRNEDTGEPNKWGACYNDWDAVPLPKLKSYFDNEQSEGTQKIDFALREFGAIYWGQIDYNAEETTDDEGITIPKGFSSASDYITNVKTALGISESDNLPDESDLRNAYATEIDTLNKAVSMAIDAIEVDETVYSCMHGRTVQGIKKRDGMTSIRANTDGTFGGENKRFPHLSSNVSTVIAASALKVARESYMKHHDEEIERMQKGMVAAATKVNRANAAATAKEACDALNGKGNVTDYKFKRTVTTTFNAVTGECTKTVMEVNCINNKRAYACKQWGDPVTTTTVISLLD